MMTTLLLLYRQTEVDDQEGGCNYDLVPVVYTSASTMKIQVLLHIYNFARNSNRNSLRHPGCRINNSAPGSI
jgi:hypothetical protein